MIFKKYTVIETRKYLEGKLINTKYQKKTRSFGNRLDACGVSDIRLYQIGTDETTGMEYIVVSTKIIEEIDT